MADLKVLSLGAGVQSSTLAFMYDLGEIGPMPDFAVFADTMAEPVFLEPAAYPVQAPLEIRPE